MKVQRWLYHPTEGGKIFEGDNIDLMRSQGWYDSPKLFPQAASEAAEPHKFGIVGSTPTPATRLRLKRK